MNRTFLYIDILGFKNFVRTNPTKVDKIFSIVDTLKVHQHFAFDTIVFSDTILIFNKDEGRSTDYHCLYLVEYSQELFYRLSEINVYFKAILTFGDFNFSPMSNIQAYYGLALIDAYEEEEVLEGFGLYINKDLSTKIMTFDKVPFTQKYDFIILCQSLKNLYKKTHGILPIDINLLNETNQFDRLEEDLRFFREIEYLKQNHRNEKVRDKYQKVYDTYKSELPLFFSTFEEQGFLPFTINSDFTGTMNPFVILSEIELNSD